MDKEQAFVSAVVYSYNDGRALSAFVKKLYWQLALKFEQYEIIVVDDFSTDDSIRQLREESTELEKPLTVIRMSLHQGREPAMNAGLDAAIGDYIYQFENADENLDEELISQAFDQMAGEYDIVSVAPAENPFSSRLFYRLFNKSTSGSAEIGSELFSVVTRRAVNRAHASHEYLPYRKSAFAASGLSYKRLQTGSPYEKSHRTKRTTALESLLLYTTMGYRISMGITTTMLLLALAELVYIVVVFCLGIPIEGWTTLALFVTIGFVGLFLIMSMIIKYLSLILQLLFQKQRYYISSVDRIK